MENDVFGKMVIMQVIAIWNLAQKSQENYLFPLSNCLHNDSIPRLSYWQFMSHDKLTAYTFAQHYASRAAVMVCFMAYVFNATKAAHKYDNTRSKLFIKFSNK